MSDVLNLVGNAPGNDLYVDLIKDNLDKRVLIINEEITDDIVENFMMRIIAWNVEDMYTQKDKRTPIRIIINSGGGEAIIGFSLVDIISSSETPVIGIVTGLAASMSFHIFIACHERIAFKNSVLLMHDGSIAISNSTSKARDTMRFFDDMEARTRKFVLGHTSMDEKFYDDHYDQEFYMYADSDGKKYGCVDKIIGEDISMNEAFS